MKMNDQVKYQLERAEESLRYALQFASKESVYVISAISKALMEIDNTLFAERIEAAVKESNITKVDDISPDEVFSEIEKRVSSGGFKWNNQTSFVPANSFKEDVVIDK